VSGQRLLAPLGLHGATPASYATTATGLWGLMASPHLASIPRALRLCAAQSHSQDARSGR